MSYLGLVQPSVNLPEVLGEELLADWPAVDPDPLPDLDQVWGAEVGMEQNRKSEREKNHHHRQYGAVKASLRAGDQRATYRGSFSPNREARWWLHHAVGRAQLPIVTALNPVTFTSNPDALQGPISV